MPAMETLQVEVPDGVIEGESFLVETSWGGCFDVCVPPDCPPGTMILCELPAPPASPSAEPSASSSTRSSPPPQPGDPRGDRERRHSREVPASNVYNRMTRRRPSHEVPPSYVSVRGAEERFVEEPMEETSPSEEQQGPHGLAAPIEACDEGHKYRPGTRVHVLRTDGSYSAGVVQSSFEGVFDVLYQVSMRQAAGPAFAAASTACSARCAVRRAQRART